MDIELPGGLWHEGRRERRAQLRELNGGIELQAGERLALGGSWPDCVTDLLVASVGRLGDAAPDRALIASLCVADRQWLLLHLLREWQGDALWLTSECPRCGARLDLGVQRSAIPMRPAGEGYPFARVRLAGREWRLRVPNGADQSAVAALPEDEARQRLAGRCLLDETAPGPLDDAALRAIGDALEAVAPELAAAMQVCCPHCGLAHEVALDPCAVGPLAPDALLDDVHALASTYHWSEHDILALPRARRLRYLERIAAWPTTVS